MFDLTGKVALVTGAGQGVGVGIAGALAAQGASVLVNDLDGDRAVRTAEAIRSAGGAAEARPFDVTDVAAVAAAGLGSVDILVNNAGIPAEMAPARFRDLTPEQWRPYVDLNLYGSLHCIRAVLDGMCDRKWGRIIQISSGAGRTGLNIGVSLYGASKSGVEGFLRHLSHEVARDGVTANALALGLMAREGMQPDVTAGIARTIPVGRLGTPEDVGAAAVWLASDEAAWVTGQTININGGSTSN